MVKKANWTGYQSIERQARTTLVDFLKGLPKDAKIESVTDLCCGGMYDTEYLLSQGYHVTATDATLNEQRINSIVNGPNPDAKKLLRVDEQFLENLDLPKTDLLYCFASLPFCDEKYFANMITNIAESINPNGYFLGTFFANHNMISADGRVGREFNKEQIETLFNYLGFNASVSTYNSEQTASGQKPDKNHNLTTILVKAQAPEQLPEINLEKIQEILGLPSPQKTSEESNRDYPSPVTVFAPQTDQTTQVNPEGNTSNTTTNVFEDYLKYKADHVEQSAPAPSSTQDTTPLTPEQPASAPTTQDLQTPPPEC